MAITEAGTKMLEKVALPDVATPAPWPPWPPRREVYYPESDGEPMAETDVHADLLIYLRKALQYHFWDIANLLWGEMNPDRTTWVSAQMLQTSALRFDNKYLSEL